mmetsp:Transcript_18245/g.21202  ORF Transcript_18245/g.21202 Transcript_18245/m.21202 type:complete len:101 (-) Transcript_18245:10-312(-)
MAVPPCWLSRMAGAGRSLAPSLVTVVNFTSASAMLQRGWRCDGAMVLELQNALSQNGYGLMAVIEESEEKFGLHVTLGGFPMKAWLKKDGGSTVLAFRQS